VTNRGGQTVLTDVWMDFYAGSAPGVRDYLLGRIHVPSLGADESQRVELNVAEFPSLPVGTYYVSAGSLIPMRRWRSTTRRITSC